MNDTEVVEGWVFPTTSARKVHYFRTRERSLCGRYALLYTPPGHLVTPDHGKPGPDDCAACRRKLDDHG